MPTFLRMMEILSCSIVGLLPYILLVVYPFRNHLRLKGYPAAFLTFLMTVGVLYYDLLSSLGTAPAALSFPQLRSAALLVLALVSIHAPIWKNLLNTLSVINLSVLITAAAGWSAEAYTLSYFLTTLALQVLLLIPYAVNLALCLAPTLNGSDAPIWKLLWVAPAVGTIAATIMLSAGASNPALALTMAALLLLAGAAVGFLLYITLTEVITLKLKKERLARKPVSAPVQTVAAPAPVQKVDSIHLHYQNLLARMAESELSSKEMLLQVMSMEDDLNNQDYDRLRERLNTLRTQLSPTVDSTGNKQIDPVITYYTRQALLGSVKFLSNVTLPEMSAVSDEDMAVLLSCLLENAMDACREQTSGTRRIALATYQDDELLQIGVKNTYATSMDPDCEQLNICRAIAARYDGKLAVIDRDGAMQVIVTLTV